MICINCFHKKTKTVNSRSHQTSPVVWRRHYCPQCHHTFTSKERAETTSLLVTSSKTTKPVAFSLGKLTISLSKSFQHNKRAADYDSAPLAQTVFDKLIQQPKPLTTSDIAQVAHQTLQKFDPIAAVQYAAQHQILRPNRRGRPSLSYAASADRSARQ